MWNQKVENRSPLIEPMEKYAGLEFGQLTELLMIPSIFGSSSNARVAASYL